VSAPRIIAGRFRGRKLEVPPGELVRPTSGRMREALFGILRHREPPLEGAAFLDLFAGSGAIGLEALSQGAARILMVEHDPAVVRFAERNIRRLGVKGEARVVRGDATRPGRAAEPFDIVYLDPPYGRGLVGPALESLVRGGWLKAEALVIAEVAAGETVDPPAGLAPVDVRRYGRGQLVLLAAGAEAAGPMR